MHFKDTTLKKEAVNLSVSLFVTPENIEPELINALVNLLGKNEYKDIVIESLEKVLQVNIKTCFELIFLIDPMSIKLGCAYLRVKGLSENAIKERISRPLELHWQTLTYTDCIISILVEFNNISCPTYGSKAVLNKIKDDINADFIRAGDGEGFCNLNLLQEYPAAMMYYIDKLSATQLDELLKKLQKPYSMVDNRFDWCQILLGNIERRRAINYVETVTDSAVILKSLSGDIRRDLTARF